MTAAPDDDAVRAAVVRLGRQVVATGLVVAAGGNIGAATGRRDRVLVTPRGWSLTELEPDDLCVVDDDGRPVTGDHEPTTEVGLHLAALAARPDAVVSIHLHPPVATLLHALGIPIRRITTDHAFYVRSLGEVPFLAPGSPELAEAVAGALDGTDTVLLRHHGCVVVADSFDLALSRAANLEAAAVATERAIRLGDHDTVCPPEHLAHVEAMEAGGWRYGRAPAGEPATGTPESTASTSESIADPGSSRSRR
jgi:L-fuculose-phosphate aldolase